MKNHAQSHAERLARKCFENQLAVGRDRDWRDVENAISKTINCEMQSRLKIALDHVEALSRFLSTAKEHPQGFKYVDHDQTSTSDAVRNRLSAVVTAVESVAAFGDEMREAEDADRKEAQK